VQSESKWSASDFYLVRPFPPPFLLFLLLPPLLLPIFKSPQHGSLLRRLVRPQRSFLSVVQSFLLLCSDLSLTNSNSHYPLHGRTLHILLKNHFPFTQWLPSPRLSPLLALSSPSLVLLLLLTSALSFGRLWLTLSGLLSMSPPPSTLTRVNPLRLSFLWSAPLPLLLCQLLLPLLLRRRLLLLPLLLHLRPLLPLPRPPLPPRPLLLLPSLLSSPLFRPSKPLPLRLPHLPPHPLPLPLSRPPSDPPSPALVPTLALPLALATPAPAARALLALDRWPTMRLLLLPLAPALAVLPTMVRVSSSLPCPSASWPTTTAASLSPSSITVSRRLERLSTSAWVVTTPPSIFPRPCSRPLLPSPRAVSATPSGTSTKRRVDRTLSLAWEISGRFVSLARWFMTYSYLLFVPIDCATLFLPNQPALPTVLLSIWSYSSFILHICAPSGLHLSSSLHVHRICLLFGDLWQILPWWPHPNEKSPVPIPILDMRILTQILMVRWTLWFYSFLKTIKADHCSLIMRWHWWILRDYAPDTKNDKKKREWIRDSKT